MAELNLKQIIDRLNEEFTGETRKLVFWYDDKAEFVEDMEAVELQNAKVYYLQPDNQFYTKYFLERVDKATNYLIYAPFPKPDVHDNHLEDICLYSKRFFADRASLLSVDLGIEEKYKPVIEKHIKFFGHKERTQRFYDLEIENFNEENILIGLLSATCKIRTCSFEEVVRVVLTESVLSEKNASRESSSGESSSGERSSEDGNPSESKLLQEFARYDLLDAFWKLCEQQFGYTDVKPTLERLLVTMFVTYTARYVQAELPAAWKSFVSYKSGNIIAFLDSLMNSVLYQDKYDELSAHVAKGLNVFSVFSGYRADELLDCDTFLDVDRIVIQWIGERLLAEDTGAKLDKLTIPEICEKRAKMHFGRKTKKVYQMLSCAFRIVKTADYSCSDNFREIVQRYVDAVYTMDQEYRKFYSYYDRLDNTETFEKLRELVENIYTNEYLAKLLPAWNIGIQKEDAYSVLPQQRAFFDNHLKYSKERTVVIISDAMRYEVGQELFARMQDDPKCTAKLSAQLSVLPSYTALGMASLLPHKTLEMTDDFQVLADGVLCDDLAKRQRLLQAYNPESVCVQFDDIKGLKAMELREILTKRQLVYVYHNQIDARGDKANTEDEVFCACEEAVREIMDLIRRISTSGNTYHFIVTADHGFLYKRDKLAESEKVSLAAGVRGIEGAPYAGLEPETGHKTRAKNADKALINRRFIVSKEPLEGTGIDHMSMGRVLGNTDDKSVSYPIGSSVFKVAGGANFVHGGSSPQEMLVPVLDIKMERGHIETRNAEIALVTIVHKITNLITSMDFIQSEAVSDVVKAARYRMFFISENNEKISNENTYVADNRDASAQKRIFRMRFTFKNKKYDRDQQYYLVVYDENTGLEKWRHPVIMDIAFADDFGFRF